ncbi:hypothetical protein EV356DRAFT_561680 [Viridothelium virens]|uniref:t-SNARE coiled-coil homology domain-containing protein n=1 Tax=Viridothelium virens TaxID=1048519 RepID=A0A6A6GWN5_VIRVR|nr:hypothetical protein EV356DRAFT_561680 [Viridothelium virens]
MSSTNPSQLLLLADHIKLSILERQRAQSLNLEGDQQDGHISRSLETLREGIESLEREQGDLGSSDNASQVSSLRTQYLDLQSQFQGWPTTTPSNTITSPNDPSLSSDFTAAQRTAPKTSASKRHHHPRTSSLKRTSHHRTSSPLPKSVRFTDSPPSHTPSSTSSSNSSSPDRARAALFPYHDDPSASDPPAPDQSDLSNQQIHAYHSRVLAEQDAQLDTLGASIGRQRELSIQIGDELEGHVALLDEVEEGVDRHQGQLDRARRRLGGVARRARENWGMTIIGILIVVLVLLIIILK